MDVAGTGHGWAAVIGQKGVAGGLLTGILSLLTPLGFLWP